MTDQYMQEAIELAIANVRQGTGGPFAALVVKNAEIIARGTNLVTTSNDPTAHAEVVAIRRACAVLGTFQLDGCVLYTTCEPCPMCLGAIYWARPARVIYASTHQDAARAGFDDSYIYEELSHPPAERKMPMQQIMRDEAEQVFDAWRAHEEKIPY